MLSLYLVQFLMALRHAAGRALRKAGQMVFIMWLFFHPPLLVFVVFMQKPVPVLPWLWTKAMSLPSAVFPNWKSIPLPSTLWLWLKPRMKA